MLYLISETTTDCEQTIVDTRPREEHGAHHIGRGHAHSFEAELEIVETGRDREPEIMLAFSTDATEGTAVQSAGIDDSDSVSGPLIGS